MIDNSQSFEASQASTYLLLVVLLLVLYLIALRLSPIVTICPSFLDDYHELLGSAVSLVERSNMASSSLERITLMRSLSQAESQIQKSRSSLAWLRTFPIRYRYIIWACFRASIYRNTHAAYLTVKPYLEDLPCIPSRLDNRLVKIQEAMTAMEKKLTVDTGDIAAEIIQLRGSVDRLSEWVMVEVQRSGESQTPPTQSRLAMCGGSEIDMDDTVSGTDFDQYHDVRTTPAHVTKADIR